jgi:small subunit ribosomal protein S8
MSVSDPIADMLTRMRNAIMAKHGSVLIPASKMKVAIAKVLKDEGFITGYDMVKDKAFSTIKISLKYQDNKQSVITGLKRVSKPGLRVYIEKGEIPRVYGGLGIAIMSTSKGIKTGKQAWQDNTGGELLCYVW